ncbi:hypothetical protein [Halodurantibacterium flavum]|uniref:Uncharacterized protein n=1 Tax=Halodurantibacterium flavum TaxID=1382802 RepID=A0ABW4S0C4_9RHOB
MMIDRQMRDHATQAIERLDQVIGRGPDAEHDEVRAAMEGVVAFRNRAVERYRTGEIDRACLDAANSLLSLAFGAEFPLSGFHVHRLEQTRDGLRALLGAGDTEVRQNGP